MLANMASSLILHKRITTTTAKAKELRSFVEPIITRSKEDSTHSRRMVFKHIRDKYAVSELFRDVAVKVGDRPGGYTRIIKLGNRQGDSADMCIIELVDYNENLLAEKAAATKPKSTRRRRGGKKKTTGETAGTVVTAGAEETGSVVEENTESAVEDTVVEAAATTEPDTETVEDKTAKAGNTTEPETPAPGAKTEAQSEAKEEGTEQTGEEEEKEKKEE
jgi:large subunit ribosomal protein L17